MNNIPIYRNPNPQPLPQPEIDPIKPKTRLSKEVISTILIVAAAPLIAFILTIFVFQSYEVEGDSMEKTLQNRNRLIVNKLDKSWSNITGNDYQPNRYDIVIFDYFGSSAASSEKQLIKRVIGLPGDRVVVKNGIVRVYNSQNPNGFNPDDNEALKDIVKPTDGNIDETVENGEVFVMGDNRRNSLDSRIFGPIKTSDVIGKLILRIYPLDEVKKY